MHTYVPGWEGEVSSLHFDQFGFIGSFVRNLNFQHEEALSGQLAVCGMVTLFGELERYVVVDYGRLKEFVVFLVKKKYSVPNGVFDSLSYD